VSISADSGDIDPRIRNSVIDLFEEKGYSILERPEMRTLFERSENMPHFQEVFRAWQNACVKFMVNTFGERINQGETLEEGIFFLQLAIDRSLALRNFHRLVGERAKAGDLRFFDHMAKSKRRPGRPRAAKPVSLVVLQFWIYGFLWLLSNEDRARLIDHSLKYPLNLRSKDPPGLVKKCSERLGLLGWADFPSTYKSEPLSYKPYVGTTDQLIVSDQWEDIFAPAS
jgi:hypothetical protein